MNIPFIELVVTSILVLILFLLFQDMALFKEVRSLQVVPGELVKPFKINFPGRLALSRAKLLDKLLGELGTVNSGFTLDNVMKVWPWSHSSDFIDCREGSSRRHSSMLCLFWDSWHSSMKPSTKQKLSTLPPSNYDQAGFILNTVLVSSKSWRRICQLVKTVRCSKTSINAQVMSTVQKVQWINTETVN